MSPLLDYTCEQCGHTVEFLILSKEDEKVGPCGACDGDMKKVEVQGGSTFILKGSCWESDGYSRYVGDAAKYKREG